MGVCVQTPEPHYYGAKTLVHLGEYLKAYTKFIQIQEDFSGTKYFAMAGVELENIRARDKDIESLSKIQRKMMDAGSTKRFEGANF